MFNTSNNTLCEFFSALTKKIIGMLLHHSGIDTFDSESIAENIVDFQYIVCMTLSLIKSVSQSVGRSVGWSVGRSVGRSVSQSVSQPDRQPASH